MLDQLELMNGTPIVPSKTRRTVSTERLGKTGHEPLWVKTLRTKEEIRAHAELWNWAGTRNSDLDLFLYFADARAEVLE